MDIPEMDKHSEATQSDKVKHQTLDNTCHHCNNQQGKCSWWVTLALILTVICVAVVLREIVVMRQKIQNLSLLVEDLQIYNGEYSSGSDTSYDNTGYKSKSLLSRHKRSELPTSYLPVNIPPPSWADFSSDRFSRGGGGVSAPARGDRFFRPSARDQRTTTPSGVLFSSLKKRGKNSRKKEDNDPLPHLRNLDPIPSINGNNRNLGEDGSIGFNGGFRSDVASRVGGFGGLAASDHQQSEVSNAGGSTSKVASRFDGFGGLSEADGSTFIRWGRPSCPHRTITVYSGYAAAAYPIAGFGGSTELECLPSEPSWNTNSSSATFSKTLITAAKFDLGHHTDIFVPEAHNSVISCAVCLATRSPVLMIPGRVECPGTWSQEYHGYLMSTPGISSQYYFSSKNYCVDSEPDFYTGHNDAHGLKLTFVQAGHCHNNSPPCANYGIKNRLGCTVCSKLSQSEVDGY